EPTLPPIEIRGTPNGIAFGRLGDRDLLLTAHFATIRVWNPRTGRKVAELPFGTKISGMSVHQTADDSILVAVRGPGVVVGELGALTAASAAAGSYQPDRPGSSRMWPRQFPARPQRSRRCAAPSRPPSRRDSSRGRQPDPS